MKSRDNSVVHSGYVKLYRRIVESPVWDDPYRLKLWLYLLVTASFRPFKAWLNKEEVTIPAGSLVSSLDKLSEHSGLTKKQIRGTLTVFERAHMVAVQRAHEGTIITILNWDTYQSGTQQEGTSEGTSEGTQRAQERALKGHTEGTPRAHEGHTEGTLQECKNLRTSEGENVLAPAIVPPSNPVVQRFTAASDPDWEKFRAAGEEYGWRFSEAEWSEAYQYGWTDLEFPSKIAAVAGLHARIKAGDPGLVRATPKNYLAKGMYFRSVGQPPKSGNGAPSKTAWLERIAAGEDV